MNVYILCAALLGIWSPVLLSLVGVFPGVRWNTNQSINALFRLTMRPRQYYVDTRQSMEGVYAQERIEFTLHWIVVCTAMTPAPFLAQLFGPLGNVFMLPAFLASFLFIQSVTYKRQHELIGHATESYVASKHGFNLEAYLMAEAGRTLGNTVDYGKLFPKWDLGKMIDKMAARLWIAKILVALHTIALVRMKKD